jgi:hypothetical protein
MSVRSRLSGVAEVLSTAGWFNAIMMSVLGVRRMHTVDSIQPRPQCNAQTAQATRCEPVLPQRHSQGNRFKIN